MRKYYMLSRNFSTNQEDKGGNKNIMAFQDYVDSLKGDFELDQSQQVLLQRNLM